MAFIRVAALLGASSSRCLFYLVDCLLTVKTNVSRRLLRWNQAELVPVDYDDVQRKWKVCEGTSHAR